MATAIKKQLWYLWIARDECSKRPKYDDEPEESGELHVFYDQPIMDEGKWQHARQLGGEIPSYMFPELRNGCCRKFIGIIGDLENKITKVIELLNTTND